MITHLCRNVFKFSSMFPKIVNEGITNRTLKVLHTSESDEVPQNERDDFKKNNKVQYTQGGVKYTVLSEKAVDKVTISKNTKVQFSQGIMKLDNFRGIASNVIAAAYKFSRKQKTSDQVSIQLDNFEERQYIEQLVWAKIRSQQWANMRGDEATPQFFENKCAKLATELGIGIQIIKGDDLIKDRFNLLHAVGRASDNTPRFINLSYNGNPQSDEWESFVGKGVCFDSGGLNLKPTAGIKQMHMDKHGATSVLSAFQSVARLKLKVNLTASIGLVQNFVSSNSYRPLDIIKSRKGITVQIGNTDAEGRLVLADCMNWTQQKYKVRNMIELSTLTGAIVIALGKKHAGLFSNSDELTNNLLKAGKQVKEEAWRMPVDEYHHQIIKSKHADISNAPGKPQASSSQAAAFLECFVEKGVNWIHLDIAGTSNIASQATGYGARSLVNYIKSQV